MNYLILTFALMTTVNSTAQNSHASTTKEKFSQETSVSITIDSDASIIWALLTNGDDITRWNSTLTYFEGIIENGEKIKLKSYLDEKRVFKLKVKAFEPEKRMVWADGKGSRVFTITKNDNGSSTFTMTEKIGGLMYPMYAKYLPNFDESFERFASDLKKEAELISNAKN